MKITKTQLRKIIQEELLKEFGSEEYGLQTKEFEPIPEVEFDLWAKQVQDILGGPQYLRVWDKLRKLHKAGMTPEQAAENVRVPPIGSRDVK